MRLPVYRSGAGGPTGRRLRAACAAVLLAGVTGLPDAALAEGLLFRLHGTAGQGWLLGSLHFGSDDLYPLSEPVERAFTASDRLMVEVNLLALDSRQVAKQLAALGNYPPHDALRRHVPEALWQRLVTTARDVELQASVFERQRPWLAALTLTTRFLERSGLKAERGIDRHFLTRAARAGLPVLELESFEQQLLVLGGLDDAEQRLMLADTLAQVAEGRGMLMQLLQAWREGNRERLRRILLGGMGSGEQGRRLMRRLLDQRNVAMARRVALELDEPGTVFVVVGTAHLLGDGGLHRELERLGILVEPR